MFKIKVDRKEDTIQILEQPDDLPDGYIQTYNGIQIRRACFPEYTGPDLYLRGESMGLHLSKINCQGDMKHIIRALQDLCVDRKYKFIKVGDHIIGEI